MRNQMRNLFSNRHRLAPIVSYVYHTNRANQADSPGKTHNISYLADAQFYNP